MRLVRRLPAIVASAVILLSSAATPAGAAGVTPEAVFNNPIGSADEQDAIVRKIIHLADAAATGSTIRMSMYYWDDDRIPDALAAAKARGVNVQVIVDYKEVASDKPHYDKLAAALGTDASKQSWLMTCPQGRGCVGDRTLGTVTAINHNKFFLFSSTDGTSNVVVQSSANLHVGRDGTRGWNNALVLAGNDGIYNAYVKYFNDLKARKGNADYYNTGQQPVTSANAKIHFYPRKESNGAPYADPSQDTIETILDHTECTGNTKYGTPQHHTVIRVSTMIFSRKYLADKLVTLDKQGCYVEVIDSYNVHSASEVDSMKKLLAGTTSVYSGPIVYYFCAPAGTPAMYSDPQWVHSKYLQIEGKYYGGADRRILWTGSHNLSYNSLRQSDETMLMLEATDPTSEAIYNGYTSNFWDMINASNSTGVPHTAPNGTATDSLKCAQSA
jgi:hypothetical protein